MFTSRDLKATLSRARALAASERHGTATVDHLLVALTEDPDAARALEACNADPRGLRATLLASLPGRGEEAIRQDDCLDELVVDVRERFIDAERSRTITGADLLAEILISDGAAQDLLRRHGITRIDVLTYISHGLRKDEVEKDPRDDTSAAAMHQIIVLNDNYTPIDFVSGMLQRILGYDSQNAEGTSAHIHSVGRAPCGTYPADIARTKAAQIMAEARAHQHPLRCVVAPVR